MRRKLKVYYFKQLISYRRALAYQRIVQKQQFLHVKEENEKNTMNNNNNETSHDTLFLLQHPSIYTLGRRSTLDNLKFNHLDAGKDQEDKIDIIRVERGGEVTWHGPGQLVGYPIFDLTKHKKDLHWFLRNIEQCIINTLSNFDLTCTRDDAGTGVWVNNSKIAAIGLSASKWVTMHGFSMNINPNLNYFDNIIPCGIENKTVTSLNKLMLDDNNNVLDHDENKVDIHTIGNIVANEFSTAFDLELDFIEIDEMEMIHTLLDLNEIDIEMINEEQTIESFNIVREVGRK